MTLSSEIIAKGEIECGQCSDKPAIRRVTQIKEGLIEVEACPRCNDPEYNLSPHLVETGELEVLDDVIFGDEKEIAR